MASTWSIKSEMSNLPPEGTYRMRVDKAEAKLSKNSGNPTLTYTCTIVSGEYEDKKQFISRTLDRKYLSFVARDFANSGTIDLESEEAKNISDDPQSIEALANELLVNKVFMWELKHQESREPGGEPRANWFLSGPVGSI
jgi:hypothetical protein